MTKSGLISRLAGRYPQLIAKNVEVVVNAILEAMTSSLATGRRIEMRGFGSFKINHRPARTGRNPRSGENVSVPAKFVPQFTAGREPRERVAAEKASGAGEN